MAAPPEKKAKKESNPNTISMVVKKLKEGGEQFSAVYRISGYPFRIRLWRYFNVYSVTLVCDKSTESDLWECAATISDGEDKEGYVFQSWRKTPRSGDLCYGVEDDDVGSTLTLTVTVKDDGDRWRRRPSLNSINPPDAVLVIGEDKKTIEVNKQFLASQSPFFDRLFFGDFMEKNMNEIPIGGVEFEEFSNIIKLVYGSNDASVTNENADNVLELADRFELKIVEDKVVSFILSGRCKFTLAKKLLMAHDNNIPFLMKKCLKEHFGSGALRELRCLKRAPEYALFSDALKVEVFDYLVNR